MKTLIDIAYMSKTSAQDPSTIIFNFLNMNHPNAQRPKMVRHALKILQHMLNLFKASMTTLGRQALKS